MLRKNLLFLLAALALMLLPRAASAQFYYYFGGSAGSYGGGSVYYITPKAPRARYDSRIDPRLIKASRIAEENAFPHSTLRCWRYVKNALLQAGAVSHYPSTNYACQAGQELTSHYGFIRLPIHDPYRAPVGAVLVYEGGGAGHVEIRTAHGFASDYRSAWACRYRLIGVYAKLSA